MGLRAKFNLALLAACAFGLAIAAVLLNHISVERARAQALQNARIMMTAARAVRRYTADALLPLLPMERDGRFVAETVPSFAAQTTFREMQADFPGFSYREPALNPTAPADRATAWEAGLIRTFRAHADNKELVLERDTPLGPTLNLAQPIRASEAACFRCHSFPAAAPSALTASYGTTNGFGWKFNDAIGAEIVSFPMAAPLKAARQALITFLTILVALFAVVFLILNLLLHYLVIGPVKRVSAMADAVSLGKEDTEVYIKPGKDEIASFSRSFNRMRESVKHAMAMMSP